MLDIGSKLKKINPLDDVYGEQIEMIPIEKLVHYEEHKFKLYDGQRKSDLVESIEKLGILTPIIVKPYDDKYMILAGHNRTECAKEAGLTEIPAKIMNVTSMQARQIVIETNLFQRSFSEFTTSEKADIISDYYSLMQKQGKNTSEIESELQKIQNENEDLSPVGTRQIATEYSLSKNSIARLLRIHKLIDDLKQKIDEKQISVRAGVDLSYLTQKNQHDVNDIIDNYDIKLDMKKSQLLKNEAKETELSVEEIKAILIDAINNKDGDKKKKTIKIQKNIVEKYFTNQSEDEIQDIIEKALEKYFIDNNFENDI